MGAVDEAEVEAVLVACQSLVAISAWSVQGVADEIDLVQLRVLVVLANRGTTSVSDLAQLTGLHVSRASRNVDRLVRKRLVSRVEDPDDRRTVRLDLTRDGRRVITRVQEARRSAIAPVLEGMSATRRTELVRALRAFAASAGTHQDGGEVASLAWVR